MNTLETQLLTRMLLDELDMATRLLAIGDLVLAEQALHSAVEKFAQLKAAAARAAAAQPPLIDL